MIIPSNANPQNLVEGGSNSAAHLIFKQDLQALANRIGLEIRVAHYPPYTSKYNPIEHRLFPHIARACQDSSSRRPSKCSTS